MGGSPKRDINTRNSPLQIRTPHNGGGGGGLGGGLGGGQKHPIFRVQFLHAHSCLDGRAAKNIQMPIISVLFFLILAILNVVRFVLFFIIIIGI